MATSLITIIIGIQNIWIQLVANVCWHTKSNGIIVVATYIASRKKIQYAHSTIYIVKHFNTFHLLVSLCRDNQKHWLNKSTNAEQIRMYLQFSSK